MEVFKQNFWFKPVKGENIKKICFSQKVSNILLSMPFCCFEAFFGKFRETFSF